MSQVSIQRVTKRFGAVAALDDVSIAIESGEMVALLGPSGCGKTTLLRCVAGLEQPDSGAITVGGVDMSLVPTRKRPIGMVFQHYALFPNMTIRQNVDFPLKVRKVSASDRRQRVDELLDLVGLTQQGDRYPHQVSGGQQQRGALARALAPSPQILLLDEPLSALDAQVRTRLRDEIRRIQQLVRITALYVTHDQSEAMAIADRVAVMNAGHIEQLGPPTEIYDLPATRFSAGFVGNRNALELPVIDGRARFGRAFDVAAPDGARRVAIFFRPEDVQVHGTNRGQSALVQNKLFLGSLTRVYLVTQSDDGPVTLYADLPSRDGTRLTVGCAVSITIDPAGIAVFPLPGADREM